MDFPAPIRIVNREQERLMHPGAPSHIFIARNEQMENFRSYLDAWCASINTPLALIDEQPSPAPSAIEGLVVCVYGHGGMGKSMLLEQYYKLADERGDIKVARIVDWQKGDAIISSQEQQRADGLPNIHGFFSALADKLAVALTTNVSALREYKQARQSLLAFRQQLRRVPFLYGAERQFAQLQFTASMPTWSEAVEEHAGSHSREQLANHIEAFLRKDSPIPPAWRQEIEELLAYAPSNDKNIQFIWQPARLLGEALGRDLSMCAIRRPLLLFFDAYECMAAEDTYLRIVMRAAGERVGWVLASRDDLWSSYAYRQRYSVAAEGYEEIVISNRGLPIDLNASGFFSSSAIYLYFNKLRAQQPSLPAMHLDQVDHIASVTQGIPLGVRIMAELYVKDPAILFKLSPVSSPTEVINQLMLHYLAYPEPKETLQLCGLALLRHMTNSEALFAALGLPADQQNVYKDVIAQLRRHADFIFDEYGAPSLHSVVRRIIRQWLLKHRNEPDKRQLFFELRGVYHKTLREVEQTMTGPAVHNLFANPQWIEAGLDLIEVLFWIDGETGMRNALPFLIAASLYRPAAAQQLIEIVTFFASHISAPSLAYWQDAVVALSLVHHHNFTNHQKVRRLIGIIDDFRQQSGDPATLLSGHRDEMIALLYWKAGEASVEDESKALDWYLRAWQSLGGNQMLQYTIMQSYLQRAYHLFDNEQYEQSEQMLEQACDIQHNNADVYYTLGNIYYMRGLYERAITFYQYAIVIEHDHFYAYMNIGNTHYMCKQYQRAIDEYNKAQSLVSDHLPSSLYYNRGNAYLALGLFEQARDDCTRAIQLDPQLAWAYGNRGHAYAMALQYEAARADYQRAAELAPGDINVVWTAMWAQFTSQPLHAEDGPMLLRVARLEPHHYVAFICRAVVEGIQNNDWSAALAQIEQAIALASDEGDPHFWKGFIAAYLGQTSVAKEEIEKALAVGLPPLFLTPLHWLQNDNPEFFTSFVKLLLQKHPF